jgi:hypothetical protein
MKQNIHVVPHKQGWAVKKEGNERASVILGTKKEAEKEGRQMAKRMEAELIIHTKDGEIQNSNSFGNDPNPPKDKRH